MSLQEDHDLNSELCRYRFGPQSGLGTIFEQPRCPFASAATRVLRVLLLPLGADGGWWRGSGGRDGVRPYASRFRLVPYMHYDCGWP